MSGTVTSSTSTAATTSSGTPVVLAEYGSWSYASTRVSTDVSCWMILIVCTGFAFLNYIVVANPFPKPVRVLSIRET